LIIIIVYLHGGEINFAEKRSTIADGDILDPAETQPGRSQPLVTIIGRDYYYY
jgi:hypothetical protein